MVPEALLEKLEPMLPFHFIMKYPAECTKGKQSKDMVQPQRADSVNTWFSLNC